MLGLADGTVRLVAHDPRWADAYKQESSRIRAALGSLALDVQHCGSTAITGLKAKPILDIVVGIKDLTVGTHCTAALLKIGYNYLGDAVVLDEHFFARGSPRTHNLHLAEWGGRVWREKMIFRDRLRADPQLRQAYEAVKEALAARFAQDRDAYTRGKSVFIRGVIAEVA